MWMPAQPVATPRHYHCPDHDVYGVGEECWIEGCTAKLKFGRMAGMLTGSYQHYVPTRRQVAIGDKQVPVGRGLKKIIP